MAIKNQNKGQSPNTSFTNYFEFNNKNTWHARYPAYGTILKH